MDWSQLETLNREREAIGIYLSSHPLDKYQVVIKHLCTATLADLGELAGKADKDFTVAGMVTGVQNRVSQKNDKPYGRIKIEDYDGNSHEFMLFDKDYEKWRIYFYTDYFLFIRGRIQNRFGHEGDLEAKIVDIRPLPDVETTMLREICVTMPVEALDGAFVASLERAVRTSEGGLRFAVKVTDRRGGVSVKMHSRSRKVALNGSLIEFLEDNELRYTIQ
jgi:DNA polymerase-3 subunit alpha